MRLSGDYRAAAVEVLTVLESLSFDMVDSVGALGLGISAYTIMIGCTIAMFAA